MIRLMLFCLVLLSAPVFAQTVMVNPDGTHSVLIDHGGGTKVIIGCDGSHSILVHHGPVNTLLPSDGTQGQLIDHGIQKILVNSDGAHSLWIDHGYAWIITSPDGSRSTLLKPNAQQPTAWHIPSGQTYHFKSRKSKLGFHPDGSLKNVKPRR